MNHFYWKALKIKWYMLGALSSFTLASFVVFFTQSESPLLAQWGLVIFLTVVGVSLFYEWYSAPQNTKWGKFCNTIFQSSYQRTKHLSQEQALFDIKTLFAALVVIFVIGLLSWIYPSQTFWFKWIITILSGVIGSYLFNEEFKSSKEFEQRYLFSFSIIVFTITVVFVYMLSDFGVKYGEDIHEFPIFIVTIGAWFSTGVVGAVLRASYQRLRDKRTAPNNQNNKDA